MQKLNKPPASLLRSNQLSEQQQILKEQLEKFKSIQTRKSPSGHRRGQSSTAGDVIDKEQDKAKISKLLTRQLADKEAKAAEPELTGDQQEIMASIQTEYDESNALVKDLKEQVKGISLAQTETKFKRVLTLKAGDSFGELALIDSRKGVRAATITCLEESTMAVINAEDYDSSLAKIEKKKRLMLTEFICSMPYFKGMHRIQINKLINSFNGLSYRRGQFVIREGSMNQEKAEAQRAQDVNKNSGEPR